MKRLAVLIDAENAQPSSIARVFDKVAKLGRAVIRRAYGNWMNIGPGWKEALSGHAIQPIQQCRYVNGKNASDIALVIDAMDILHGGMADGFCLVTSDSDYTRLAIRIREAGLFVYGFGKKDTPKPFVAACDAFDFVSCDQDTAKTGAENLQEDPSSLEELFTAALSSAKKDDGWVGIGELGNRLRKADPSFSQRKYGFGRLIDLVLAQSYLRVRKVPGSGLFVRLEKKETPPGLGLAG